MSVYDNIDYKINSFNRKYTHLGITGGVRAAAEKTLFAVRIEPTAVEDAFVWCDEQFGDNWIWSSFSPWDYMDLFFQKSEDALICRLKYNAIAA